MEQPQLDHTLDSWIKNEIFVETICRVIFNPDYITSASIAECYYRLRVTNN